MNISRGIFAAAVIVLVVLLASRLGSCGRTPGASPVVEIREVESQALLQQIAALELEADGLRARLKGVERRAPEVIYRGTEPVIVPETLLVVVAADRHGVISAGGLVGVGAREGAAVGVPELATGARVGDCDGGWSYSAGGLVCDPARFGHLTLVASASAGWRMEPAWPPLRDEARIPAFVAEAGLSWTPSFRSSRRIDLTAGTDQRVRIRMQTGLRLF